MAEGEIGALYCDLVDSYRGLPRGVLRGGWNLLHELCYQAGRYNVHGTMLLLKRVVHMFDVNQETFGRATAIAHLARNGTTTAYLLAAELLRAHGADATKPPDLLNYIVTEARDMVTLLLDNGAPFVADTPFLAPIQARYKTREANCRRAATALMSARLLWHTGVPRDLMRYLIKRWLLPVKQRRLEAWE